MKLRNISLPRFFTRVPAQDEIDRLAFQKTPSEIAILTNETCNLRCLTCFAWRVKDSNDLTRNEIKSVFKDLRDWLGPVSVNLVGGEPFHRSDMVEILQDAKQIGIKARVTTNASLIGDREAEALISCCEGVNISLNAMSPEIHDYTRGFKGSFQLIMDATERLKKYYHRTSYPPFINYNTIYSAYNIEEMIPILNWVKNLGIATATVSYQAISFPYWREFDPTWKSKSPFWPHTVEKCEQMREVAERLIRLKKSGWPISNSTYQLNELKTYFVPVSSRQSKTIKAKAVPSVHTETVSLASCQIGYHNLVIKNSGQVRICHDLPAIGTIRDGKTLRELWIGSAAKKLRDDIGRCGRDCRMLLCNLKEGS